MAGPAHTARSATAFALALLLTVAGPHPAAAAADAPTDLAITASLDPVSIGSTVVATASFTDADSTTHTAIWDWGDGVLSNGTVANAGAMGTVTGSHPYTAAGVYRVGLTVTDETGASAHAQFEYVVVYDSGGGFVTGGGFIVSPPGAYTADPSLTGRATFGLVSKYKPGANQPDGTTEFQFRAASFNFHSSDYDWLAVSGARAQYKGTGTIQGRAGTYSFLVTVIDGDLLGGDAPDRFRIKITGTGGVVYDNQQGSADDADPTTALSGGQIVIHKSKVKPTERAPVANAGPDQTVTPGTTVALSGALSSDPDGDPLTYAWSFVSRPAGSTATLIGASTVAPTFVADAFGIYIVQLVVNDGALSSPADQVRITANTAPTVDAGADRTPGVGETVNVVATFVDPDVGDTHTATIDWGDGTVAPMTVNEAAKTASASHAYATAGARTATVTVTDSLGASGSDSLLVSVATVAHAPTAVNDAYAATEDTVLSVAAPGVLANDTDPDGDALSAVLVSGPSHGTLALAGSGSFTYTPDANYNGPDGFSYRASDGTLSSGDATVTLAVAAVNDAPVAMDDTYATAEDTGLVIAAPGVLANDTDADGDALTAELVAGPMHGTLAFSSDGSFTYTPDADFAGADSFTYRASDGTALSNVATVHIAVGGTNDAPDAHDDTATTDEDTAVSIDVLANDTDADGTLDLTSLAIVTAPAHGTATVDAATHQIVYTPAGNYAGNDSLTYQICDEGALCDSAAVTITVRAVNDAPVAFDDTYGASEDTTLVIAAPGVLGNDMDVDGDALAAVLVTGPTHGSLALSADGSFTYAPASGFSGSDAFTYRASDGGLASNIATVHIAVAAVNDAPVAFDDTYGASEDTTLVIAAPGVLGNDVDADGATLAAVLVTGPAHGSLALAADGSFTYTPDANYNGPDSFTYRASDGTLASNIATVHIAIAAVNDAPVALDDSYSTNEDMALTIAAPGVLANDSDVDGDALSAVLVIGPAHGTLALAANGSFTYLPAADFNGADSFTYRTSDGSAASNTATVHLSVAAVNDAPVAGNDSASTNENTAVSIDVLANDSDVDDPLATLTITIPATPPHGTASVDPATRRVVYTPATGYSGADFFNYLLCDAALACDAGVVNIQVAAVNEPPIAQIDTYGATEDMLLAVAAPGVLVNDSDPDGDALSAVLVTGPAHGALALAADGSFTYTPAADFSGSDSFTYRASDGALGSSDTTATITVAAVNDAPLAQDDTATTDEDTAVSIDVLANDTDVDSALVPGAVSIITQPAHGATTIDPATGRITYTPAQNYFGPDTLTYRVCDAGPLCDTADVAITVTSLNDAPVANAGPDQNVATGELVALAGSGSDADGDTLTFTWEITVAPPGSTASLTGADTATPSFTPDRTGTFTLTLTVSDSHGASATDTVDVVVAGKITLTPDPLTLQTNATGTLTATLSAPAGAGGVTLALSASPLGIVDVPTSVVVPAGSSTAPINVTSGTLGGTVQVTASALGYTSGSATVNVGERALTLVIQDELVGVGRTTNATVTLSTPAPAGGTLVTLTMANTSIATVAPLTLTIPAGGFAGSAVVTGVAVGSTGLTASAPGYTSSTATVNVTDALISIGFVPTLGPDETQGVPISLTKPAPTAGLPITLVSSNPAIASITPSVTVPAGAFLPPANPVVTAHLIGTTQITATAPGFAPDHRTITVAVFLSFSPTTLTLGTGTSRNITLNSSATAASGGLTVNLDTDDHTKATVPATATIPQGQTSVVISVTGVGNGTTTLRASAPGITQATAQIIVGAPITMPTRNIGKDLQETIQATLGAAAPAGNLPVTFTSSDPTKLIISAAQTAQGGSSATVTAAAGSTATPAVYLQGLASTGSVTVTASAPGYANGTVTVSLFPSGFYIFVIGGGTTFSTTTFAANTQIFARSARLNASNQLVGADQELRGGLNDVMLNFASSVPTVGTITAPLEYDGGTGSSKFTFFDPTASGTTVISFAMPAGFSTPTTSQTITATVDAPDLFISSNSNPSAFSVGRDLQFAASITLQNAPPAGAPVDVSLSVVSGTDVVKITRTQTAAGGTSAVYNGVTTTFAGNLYIQGLTTGTAQIRATAPGYDDGVANITVTASGFYINVFPQGQTSFTTNSFAAPTTIAVRSSRLNASNQLVVDQEVRGGLTVKVDVASSNPTVGTITTSPVEFVGGTGATKFTTFDPASSGTAIISYTVPAGFSVPTTFQIVTATVDAPDVQIGGAGAGTFLVGRDLQMQISVQLEAAPPAGTSVDVTLSVEQTGGTKILISTAKNQAGADTVTFSGVTTANVGTVWVQGIANGDAHVIGTATNYNNGDRPFTVVNSGFYMTTTTGGTITTNNFASNTAVTVHVARLTASGNVGTDQELRGGIQPVSVPVVSSQPTVGIITSSPLIFTGGGGFLQSTEFDPQTVGTSILSIPSPVPGFTVPTGVFQTITANVRAPEVRIASGNVTTQRIGKDLQIAVQVTLEDKPPQPVNVTVTVAAGGESITRITRTQTAAGDTVATFTGVTTTTAGTLYIQGHALGSTNITAIAAGYNDATATISVEPSGFYVTGFSLATTINTTAGAANSTIVVHAAALDPVTLNQRADQELRGGMTPVSIAVTSSNTAVGTILTSPVTFTAGTGGSTRQTLFDPASVGTAVVTIPTPVPGFSTVSNFSIGVTVNVAP